MEKNTNQALIVWSSNTVGQFPENQKDISIGNKLFSVEDAQSIASYAPNSWCNFAHTFACVQPNGLLERHWLPTSSLCGPVALS